MKPAEIEVKDFTNSGRENLSSDPDSKLLIHDVENPSQVSRGEVPPPRLERKETWSDYVWRSCCIDIHPGVALFCSQMIIMLSVLAFCAYKLSSNLECPQMNAYFFLLGSMLGWVKEPPKLRPQTIITQNNVPRRNWRSCCFDIHPDAAKFFAQMIVLCFGLAICYYKLSDKNLPCPQVNAYIFLLGSLVGWVKEAPSLRS